MIRLLRLGFSEFEETGGGGDTRIATIIFMSWIYSNYVSRLHSEISLLKRD